MTFIYGPDFRIADDQIRSGLSLRPTLRTTTEDNVIPDNKRTSRRTVFMV